MEKVLMYVELVLNLSLLVALSVLSGFIDKRRPRNTRSGALAQGALFGIAALLGMLRPMVLGPGLIFDGRSVMVSLCALYFGPWAALPASAFPMAYRISLGGTGMATGVMVILSSMAIGLLARRRLEPDTRPPTAGQLYVLGLLVHAAMIALMFTLPGGAGPGVVSRIGPPVLILYPLAMILTGKILSDQVDSRRILATLRESEERFERGMEATNDGIWDWDVKTDVAYYSPAYHAMLGYGPGELPTNGAAWKSHVHPDDYGRALAANQACIEGRGDHIEIEFRMRAKDGTWRWIYSRGKCVARDAAGRAQRIVGTHVDVTGRKRGEEELRRSLAEKDVLLREVHHRVKNNLNVISSLLGLQALQIRNPEEALAAFHTSQDRIMAMSMAHDELYRSRDFACVDMGGFVEELAARLRSSHPESGRIRLETSLECLELDVNTALPCGLILNELVGGAFAHAFPSGREGTIRVLLRDADDGRCELGVADDGIGLPADYQEHERGYLSLSLVRLLTEQLGGELRIAVDGGTSFRVVFPREPVPRPTGSSTPR
ncbi:MAG: PAS domain-containing protein [Spirochaetaceae bacterium]|nr:PAS domain-containing protein [Spirochaetaceae bacterium]